ncbi:hypothetical protein SADUNF_Sadunf03G0107900 [Salix dunnii]|uniref:Uncharacterized protein n=1 Tax=Salix dunnii TaxID=1413687 RepID=A0A835KA45_9ROSI|nr:hypothetical protein SADUNF_Sadunf03G0107900 [Salix dunnii]
MLKWKTILINWALWEVHAFPTVVNHYTIQLSPVAYAELLEEDEINIPARFSFNSNDGIDVDRTHAKRQRRRVTRLRVIEQETKVVGCNSSVFAW